MTEHPAPGVYIEEASRTPGPIAAAPTASAGFVGVTAKGPTDAPTPVRSVAEYSETFGAVSPDSPLSLAIQHFFVNGGRQALVVRIAARTVRGRIRVASSSIIGKASERTGIHALLDSRLPALLLTPDAGAMSWREHDALAKGVISFCETYRMFYVADAPRTRPRVAPVRGVSEWAERGATPRHPNVAVYFPSLRASGASGGPEPVLAPASGAVAGIYARSDRQRGVWKAPAGTGTRIHGACGVEVETSDRDVQRLQAAGINPLRPFPSLGIVVWGARTFDAAASASEWKYVPVRRFALFLERSLHDGLAWTVFEPNAEPLWAQVRLSVFSFLNHVFRLGAFAGASAREAYFVRCGRGTMTERDVRDGRVVVLVGFAPLKPAEFVVLRLALRAAGST